MTPMIYILILPYITFKHKKKPCYQGLYIQMVTRTGFEPVNDAVKGRCVKPLHQRAIYVNREVNVIFPNALLIYHKQIPMSTTFLNIF